jgi:hypothetical protein
MLDSHFIGFISSLFPASLGVLLKLRLIQNFAQTPCSGRVNYASVCMREQTEKNWKSKLIPCCIFVPFVTEPLLILRQNGDI